jgi:hypothetical protein
MRAQILSRPSGVSVLAPTEHHALSFGQALSRLRRVPVVNGVVATIPSGSSGVHGMSADDRRLWMTLPSATPPVMVYYDTLTGTFSSLLSPPTSWNPIFPVVHPNGHVYVSDLSNPVLWDYNVAANTWNSFTFPQPMFNRIVVDGMGNISSTTGRSITPSGQIINWATPANSTINGDILYFLFNGALNYVSFSNPYSDTICVDAAGRVIGLYLTSLGPAIAIVYDPTSSYQPIDAYMAVYSGSFGSGAFAFACDGGDAIYSGAGSNFVIGIMKTKSTPQLLPGNYPNLYIVANSQVKSTPVISSNASPLELCLGPDSCIWSSDNNANIYQIDRVTMSVTTYTTTAGSINITNGPDGCVYACPGGNLFQIAFADRNDAIQDFVSNPVTISQATASIGDGFHFICNGAAAQTVTLPQSPNRWIHIFKTSAATIGLTVNPPSGGTINGSATGLSMSTQYSGALLFSDATGLNWYQEVTIV